MSDQSDFDDEFPSCRVCGSDMDYRACWQCDGGCDVHDCGEDCCCCLYPEDNVRCEICGGSGGWWVCLNSECSLGQRDDEG